ncbi:MAG: hypothetical protein B7Z72_12670 [Gemmatimonadetes bacterium 21-71-4]|nr:MAG: hypothetical protein B7Z72_12670 [Gemmatimonadetes bacterium 21-71-4]
MHDTKGDRATMSRTPDLKRQLDNAGKRALQSAWKALWRPISAVVALELGLSLWGVVAGSLTRNPYPLTPALAAAQQIPARPAGISNQQLLQAVQQPGNAAQIEQAIQQSGLTPDQIRAQLQAAGYPAGLLDAYMGQSSGAAAPSPNADVAAAMAALGMGASVTGGGELASRSRRRRRPPRPPRQPGRCSRSARSCSPARPASSSPSSRARWTPTTGWAPVTKSS